MRYYVFHIKCVFESFGGEERRQFVIIILHI